MSFFLQIKGSVQKPENFSFESLRQLKPLIDIAAIDPKKQGRALPLSSVLEQVKPSQDGMFLILHASKDDFSACVPLQLVKDRSYLIFELDGKPLLENKGGPVRFLIPDSASCQSDEIDECANVKFVDCLEISNQRISDTRPKTQKAHEDLHAKQSENFGLKK